MKQAILITAYKNYFHLEKIINFFDSDFQIYIHLDRKSDITDHEREKIENYPQVKLLVQEYKVNWGGLNHLKAILYLSTMAVEDKENVYFHLISGHDHPIKNLEFFKLFYQRHGHRNFLEYFKVPFKGWGGNGGLDRLEYFNLFDIFNYKSDTESRWINNSLQLQRKLGLKRGFGVDFPEIYGGSTWWSLNRDALTYVLDYQEDHPSYLKRFRHTLCSEEFFFQTILLNSPFLESINNNNLRYIDWTPRNGNNPAVLDETDYQKIAQSDALFARKFDYPVSCRLMEQLSESKISK
ncbi:beta-1,6-N-acetylglucosaminyltransferase [Autumnicola edwardsiae]|uniref:Peptide O-xylosyltransferase n=1 Tax=Autumnicola edwardsiae TaxID=3075594 RepID=A0ABU3CWX2_9FLAO|nr:beta-1,6-N-acetylglucosaminyltransferase [Zunongwangia sp. F297]MDT0650829.1 beta-1,6-N-acetylglucosaminyltransferase [Zunongwangia sp. F297]